MIGAGVVGLAIARQLAARDGTSTILLERHGAVGTETSSRNSEVSRISSYPFFFFFFTEVKTKWFQVIHAGIYYPPQSLKTRLCIRGNRLLYSFCAARDIPHRNTKKWIVAQDEREWEACLRLHKHATSLGVPTRLVGCEEARRREPDIQARAGIVESEWTGIIDSHALMTVLLSDFEDRGGDVALGTAVTRIERDGSSYRIFASSDGGQTEDSITAETLINSAGLYACHIQNMLLPPSRHRTPYYAKGTYFSYSASRPGPINTLVYPAPGAVHGGLGTHLTLDMANRIRFGPDVEWVPDATDLVPNPSRLSEALEQIRRYLPGIDPSAISLDYCGIRPKLRPAEHREFQDFVIQKEDGFDGFVNLLGIESPGLTSALAIAEEVERLLYR